ETLLCDGGGGDQQGGERGQRGEQATRMHWGHSSERPKPPAREKPSADRLLQLLRGLEARHAAAHRHGLPRARVLHRARLATRHGERPEPDERHGVAVLERRSDAGQQGAHGALGGRLGPSRGRRHAFDEVRFRHRRYMPKVERASSITASVTVEYPWSSANRSIARRAIGRMNSGIRSTRASASAVHVTRAGAALWFTIAANGQPGPSVACALSGAPSNASARGLAIE